MCLPSNRFLKKLNVNEPWCISGCVHVINKTQVYYTAVKKKNAPKAQTKELRPLRQPHDGFHSHSSGPIVGATSRSPWDYSVQNLENNDKHSTLRFSVEKGN